MPHLAISRMPCLYCNSLTDSSDQFCCSGCRFLFKGEWKRAAPKPDVDQLIFDQKDIRGLYNLAPLGELPRYRFAIQGLQCSSCVHLLEDLPQFLEEVVTARIQFSKSELYIETNTSHSVARILKFLGDMGYPARPLRAEEKCKDHTLEEDRALLSRIAVAGACAGNITLFSVAVYAGLTGPTAFIFNSISLLLFLPVLLYSASPMYRGAWTAAKLGYLTVDVPLVIALWLGFAASLFNWWRGSGNIYFDSTAGFFFLILTSRWFLRASQRRWGQDFFSVQNFADTFYDVIKNEKKEKLIAAQISVGDKIFLTQAQIAAVDGTLLSENANFDTSWLTGESLPRDLQAGMTIPAGYKLLSPFCEIKATSTSVDSELAQSLRRMETQSLSQSRRVGSFDKAAQILLAVVFALALGILATGSAFFGLSMEESFERALSLLIVACPCALAFGGPLAYGLGLRKAARAGVLVKSADVFDKVLDCQSLVFDKTGTLTKGQLELVKQTPSIVPEWIKDLILKLESQSHHPVAYAFRKLWTPRPPTHIDVRDISENVGKNVFGVLDGRLFSIQTANEINTDALSISLTQDGQTMATFEFEDCLRENVDQSLLQLSKKFSLHILSGDRQSRVNEIVKKIPVSFATSKGDCSPQAKAAWIKNSPPSIMLGDGINDAEALSSAHVGIVVQGPMVQGLGYGSVYFLKPGITPLFDLIAIAKKTRSLIIRNLSFALAYNTVAGIAALLGFVNPLVAALLMPLSSGLILLSTWEASR